MRTCRRLEANRHHDSWDHASVTSAPSTTPKRSPLGIVMSIYVLLTIIGAVRALFAVQTTVFRIVLVSWIALGLVILWLRWRATK